MNQERKITVVLVRHGETEGNVKGIVQGQSDTPLTKRGIESTLRKAEKIRHLFFDAAFCSDIPRTVHTFDLLRERIVSLPDPIYSRDLREIDFGDLTGQRKTDIMPIILKHKADPNLCYPNGESGAQFIARVRGFFSKLCEHNSGQNILIVTHFGVMETAARQFTGPPAYENIMIGVDDVWLVTLADDLTVVKEVV